MNFQLCPCPSLISWFCKSKHVKGTGEVPYTVVENTWYSRVQNIFMFKGVLFSWLQSNNMGQYYKRLKHNWSSTTSFHLTRSSVCLIPKRLWCSFICPPSSSSEVCWVTSSHSCQWLVSIWHLVQDATQYLLPDKMGQQVVWFRPLITTHAVTFPKGNIGFPAYFISIKTFLGVKLVTSVQSVPLLQHPMIYKTTQSSE